MHASLQVLLGLGALILGAELLVRGSAQLATRLGVTPLVIGLTVMAYGTSAPELAVCLTAAWRESPGLVIGNVIGSNTANLGLVLGVAALIRPLAARASLLQREIPFMLLAALLVPLAALGGAYTRLDGVLLLAAAVVFSLFCFASVRQHSCDTEGPSDHESSARPIQGAGKSSLSIAVLILAGVAGLGFGSTMLVEGSISLAASFGVSDHVIGLTVVAIGTSLPELATCVVGAIRGKVDLVVGNVIGSNIFNVFLILGGTAAIHPITAPDPILGIDMVLMLALSVAIFPFILTGSRISRLEGLICLGAYAAFLLLSISARA